MQKEQWKHTLGAIFNRKKTLRGILLAVLPASLFYGVSLLTLWFSGFRIMQIIRDTAQQSGASSFLGFLSNIGIWLWVSSAAICFFSVLTWKPSLDKKRRELLLLTGMLSILLAVDDFFMIHDRYIDQNICYLTYAVLALLLLMRHHKMIIAIDGFAFLLAGFFLGSSIFTDVVQEHIPLSYEYVQIFEEGFKFVGAATWLYFIGRAASFER